MIENINCTVEIRRAGKLNDLIVRGEDGKIITQLSGYSDNDAIELRGILQKVYSKTIETASLNGSVDYDIDQ